MSNNSKRISDLAQVTSIAPTDRVVVLVNPATTANVETVTVNNFLSNVSSLNAYSISSNTVVANTITSNGLSVNTITSFASNSVTYSVGSFGTTIGGFIANSSVVTVGNTVANVQIAFNSNDSSITEFALNSNNFAEVALYNANTGNNASADFIVNDTNGPAQSNPNYIDVGINGNAFNQASWTISGPSDGYVYTGNTNLSLGTAGPNYLNFFTGGTLIANERMRITNTGNVGIGTTSPGATLDVRGSVNATSLMLGSSSKIANGYSYLPNGLIEQWGTVAANSSVGNATFPIAFPNACLSVSIVPVGAFYAYQSVAPTTTVLSARTNSTTTAANVQYIAIGY
jgi:hypothetical protein